ncbi:hypothetical protein WR25_03810 [Diploscapter pachys]|uniref:G-protein coupled receptors family 1 profile domain-containing protein n=1 Tax=Diploscapter pachys TaxID=2018661 RepID=A0A2A2J1C8_9BILA|nr:hypothetical protein WR25_03810 [Diploscapter pachys]
MSDRPPSPEEGPPIVKQALLGNCSVPARSIAMLFDGPLSTVVILLGVLGNAYCLKVLFSRSINTSMLVSLTGLAIWDMVLLLASFFHYSMWSSLYYVGLTDYPWNPHLIALNGLVECGHITATWMLIEVTAERFFAVARPFHFSTIHRKQRRKSYAKLIAGYIRLPLVMTLVACIITLPCSFEYGIEPCIYNSERRFQRHKTPLLNNIYYRVLYKTIFLSVAKTFGPFIIITLLTVSTVKSMRKSMNSRASILMQQGKDHLFKADRDKTKSLQVTKFIILKNISSILLIIIW